MRAFTAKTPHLAILALLFVQGLLRSLQLLLLNIIGYSELTDREFSAASTISSMSQQMAQGVGIAIAVIAVQMTQRLTGTQGTTIQTIAPAFIVVALLSLLSIWWRGAVNGLAAAGTTLLSISMLPDIMEYDRIKTGLRREGIFSGIYTIVEKLGFALGAAITGAVLSFSGYIPTTSGRLVDQPSLAISGLYAGASIIPALLICISMGLMLFYRLDEKALRAMRQ